MSLSRRVAWIDTDAAGIWHHSTAIRWAEDAEAELHRRLGIIEETFGATPRVRVEFEYAAPLAFDAEVLVTLEVASLGESSITYEIGIEHAGASIARGRMIAVLIDRETGAKRPWPHHLREVLE